MASNFVILNFTFCFIFSFTTNSPEDTFFFQFSPFPLLSGDFLKPPPLLQVPSFWFSVSQWVSSVLWFLETETPWFSIGALINNYSCPQTKNHKTRSLLHPPVSHGASHWPDHLEATMINYKIAGLKERINAADNLLWRPDRSSVHVFCAFPL